MRTTWETSVFTHVPEHVIQGKLAGCWNPCKLWTSFVLFYCVHGVCRSCLGRLLLALSPQVGGSLAGNVAFAGGDTAAVQAARSTDVAAVVVPILFLILLSLGVGFAILYTKHRRLQSSFTAFANSHYSSRLGSAIFSSGDDLGK